MLLEKAVVLAAVVISYFLQTSVDFFRLGDIKPDFLLILTVYLAVHRGEFAGLWIGFLGGMLQDTYLGGVTVPSTETVQYYFGTHALPKTLIGYLAGKFSKGINKEGTAVISVVIFVLSLFKGFLTFFVVAIFHANVSAQSIITIVFPEAFYNAIISIFWIRLLLWALPTLQQATPSYR